MKLYILVFIIILNSIFSVLRFREKFKIKSNIKAVLVCVAKQEEDYIEEWVKYHLALFMIMKIYQLIM